MKTCLILTGGFIEEAFAGDFLQNHSFDVVLAVDAGLAVLDRFGITPDGIVGDFDTVDPRLLERYRHMDNILWDEHQPEKDETDTELAFVTASSLGCTDIVVLGATGGRMDHTIGNLQLLFPCLEKGQNVSMVDAQNRICLLDKGRTFHRDQLWGNYISFLPLTMEVHGITLTGFKYPLSMQDIRIGTSLCISNELTGETGTITFTDGVLICVESHDY